MSTTLPAEAPITSVQPGGGFVYGLERAWGRLRRATLRRVFPGYVRRMLSLRQGDCPGCAHDIIDGRDLKFVSNVCGYRFRPEDDAFAWRGRLGLARAGLAELLFFSLILLPLTAAGVALALLLHPAFWAAVVVTASLWIFVVSFFRDPDRVVPADPAALVSPADGVVTHVEEVDDEPGIGRCLRVSIFLSVFNVHVNRSPRRCRVARVAYYPGEFLDARAVGVDRRNEQLWLDLDDVETGRRIRVKQIAGAIARRIVCQVGVGATLAAGERFGMIKFGSRTDVLVPAELVAEARVKVGQAVRSGADVLLVMRGR